MNRARRGSGRIDLFVAIGIIVVIIAAAILLRDNQGTTVTRPDGQEALRFDPDDVQYIELNGHHYIKFVFSAGQNAHGGVVHDPDCPCNQ